MPQALTRFDRPHPTLAHCPVTLSASLYQPPHHCLTLPLSIPLCASLSVSLAVSVSLTPTLTLWSCQGLDDTDDDTPFRHIEGMAKPQKVPLSPPISFPWLTLVVGLCRSPRQSSNSGTTHSIYLSVCLHSPLTTLVHVRVNRTQDLKFYPHADSLILSLSHPPVYSHADSLFRSAGACM